MNKDFCSKSVYHVRFNFNCNLNAFLSFKNIAKLSKVALWPSNNIWSKIVDFLGVLTNLPVKGVILRCSEALTKKISLSLTIISCVVATTQLLYLYMREANYLQALVAPECWEALEESEILTSNDISYYENTFASFRE